MGITVFKNTDRRAQSSMADRASFVRSEEIAERIGARKRRITFSVSVSPRVEGFIEHKASDNCCQESSVSGLFRIERESTERMICDCEFFCRASI